ncbi:hypothetical protein [Microbacterium memoriense]|uniref:DUF4230 domain-containing protein n=1 Tax=Microbacterium memoriense TaxID=2978350 RepID=A0ABT2P8U6_9MICO|nr:hypothetical protein [Microbacterium memoriense]MCT9001066.1 hypothetical protein [Microbacterium memoriense]
MKFFRAKVRLWPLVVVPLLLVAAVVGVGFSGALRPFTFAGLFGGISTQSSEVVKYVLPKQEVALASLRVEGLERADSDGNLMGIRIPAGDRTKLIQYSFDAKIGIDGSAVTISEDGDHAYTLTIPAFIFIGHSNERFEDPIESNGILSWLSAEIEDTDMVNTILSEDKKAKYVANSLQVLKDQTEAFYGSIIRSVDNEADLSFKFSD